MAALSKVAAGLLALGPIVSGVLTFMKPERTAEQHLAAGRQVAALRVYARQVLNLDLPALGSDEFRKAINDIASKRPLSMTAHQAHEAGITTWPATR